MADTDQLSSKPVSAARQRPPRKRPLVKKSKKTDGKAPKTTKSAAKVKSEGIEPLLKDLMSLNDSAREVSAGIQKQLTGKIDGIVARLKSKEGASVKKKHIRKIRSELKRLNVKKGKGRLKDLRRVSRTVGKLEKIGKEEK